MYSKYNNQQSYTFISSLPLNQKINFKYIDNVVYLNDEVVITHTKSEWEDNIDAMFGYFSGEYYYLRIKDGNTILFDLVPKKVNGNIVMYDLVNNRSYP